MLTMLRRLCDGTTEGKNRITEGVSEEVVYIDVPHQKIVNIFKYISCNRAPRNYCTILIVA